MRPTNNLTRCEWAGAKWIWIDPGEQPFDVHVLARKGFALESTVRKALCLIGANNSYELTVNGTWIGRGPVRSWPEWQYVDEYDVTEVLTAGDNVLAMHAYHHGTDRIGPLEQSAGPGGLIVKLVVDLEDGRSLEVVTDDSWHLLRDPAYAVDAGFVTWHRHDYKELFDARRERIGWCEPGFDDREWGAPVVLGSVPCKPWTRLLPRPIPPFTHETVRPINAFGHLSGGAYGFTDQDIQNPYAVIRDDEQVTEIKSLNDNFEVQLLLDFGKPVVGRFHLDVTDSVGGEILVSYGESLSLTRVDRLLMRPGAQHWQPYERRFARYVMLTFRELSGPLKLRGAWFELVTYPVEAKGEFECSDAMLNRIWDAGRWTLRMNMHDHFEDCPWREQTLYSGDLRVSALLAYYAFGDCALARESLVKMARIQHDNGAMPNHGPVPSTWKRYIPEYTALWLTALGDYRLHSGDQALVEALWPNVKAVLAWYDSWRDDVGLMKQLPGEIRADFIDNLAGIRQDGQVLAVQCFYYLALRIAERLAKDMDDRDTAVAVHERADNLRRAVNDLFWDEALQGYVDCLPERGEPGKHSTADIDESKPRFVLSKITNGLALYCGVVPDDRRTAVTSILLDADRAGPARAGYMNYYIVEALFDAGRAEEALALIRDYWGGMIERGATTFWEVFDPETPAGEIPDRMWSLCHEFCCGPVHSLPLHVLGVEPLDPGFASVLIAPVTAGIEWSRGTVPTPLGGVDVSWQRADGGALLDLQISRPAGMAMEVVLPAPIDGKSAAVTIDGKTQDVPLRDARIRLTFDKAGKPQTQRIRSSIH